MSKVIIDDTYFVTIDDLNHTLYKHDPGGYEVKGVGKKVGETFIKGPSDTVIGYFPNMRQCVSKVIDIYVTDKVSKSDMTLLQYEAALTELGKELGGRFDQ